MVLRRINVTGKAGKRRSRLNFTAILFWLMVSAVGGEMWAADSAKNPETEKESARNSNADYVVEFWRMEQGLPHNTVTALAQTRDGYLWVGTAGGLVRFDGLVFTTIGDETAPGLKDARITALLQDRDGALWVGTQGGGVFRLNSGGARHFTAGDGLTDNAVTSLSEDTAGNVWIGTQRGLNYWKSGQLHTFTSDTLRPGDGVVALHAGRSGVLWITTRSTVYQMQDGHVKPFQLESGRLDGNADLRGVYEDRAGNLWAFGATFLLNLSQGKRHNAFGSLDSASSRVWTICEQDDGTFWIGTSGRGLVRFSGGRFDVVGTQEGLDQCDVRALLADRDGNLWIGTSGSGLARLRSRPWRIVGPGEGLPPGESTSLAANSAGQLWAGTADAGLQWLKGGRFERFSAGPPLDYAMHISSLCVDHSGALWVGTWGDGLFKVWNGRQRHFTTADGLSGDTVTAIIADPDNNVVWAGTRAGGLHRISATNMVNFSSADGLTGQAVLSLLPSPGGLIVGSAAGGLVQWNGKDFSHMISPPELVEIPVRCLAMDAKGRLWAGTAGAGVFCRKMNAWVQLNSKQGLASDSINEILQDDAGNYWFASDTGTFQVRAGTMEGWLLGGRPTVNCVLCGRGNGNPGSRSGDPASDALKSAAGNLWFTSNDGLLEVDPANVKAAAPLRVMIEGVAADGRALPLPSLNPEDHPIRLGPGVQSLDFSFAAVNFTAPERTRYKHKLEGYDSDWVLDDTRKAHYGPLPPGHYRFRVMAANADGVWSLDTANLSLISVPPVWRAWWFLTLASLGVVGLIWITVRYVAVRRLKAELRRSEQRRAMERERTRIAQDMHDEIGSKLTRISFLSEVARQSGNGHSETTPSVEAIADTSRELLQSLDEIVWAVNPRNDNLEHLVGYLEQYAREYFQVTPIECELSVPTRLPIVPLTAEARHNIFLAFEEALTNALKHARPTRVRIEMSLSGPSFSILVQDDGCGFAPSVAGNGAGRDGLSNMRERMRGMGGEIQITSRPGIGTSVRLSFPLAGETAGLLTK